MFPRLTPGGHWRPHDCKAQQRLAVIIPYRDDVRGDRAKNLSVLLRQLNILLQGQKLQYQVLVIEQV